MLNSQQKTRVGVLRGGVGPEYNTSLETGSYVLANIPKDKYKPVDILIDREGVWHQNGVPFSPEDLKEYIDVVFNTLHGIDGEDGRIQNFLESIDVPFIGSDSLSSALTGNKTATKERLNAIGYKTPKYLVLQDLGRNLNEEEKLKHIRRKAMEVFKKMSGPWIVKPILGAASTNIYLVTTFSELIIILDDLSDSFNEILVEEYINGKEVATAILNNFRGQEHYAMPIHEVLNKIDEEAVCGPRGMCKHRIYVVGNDNNQKKKIEAMTKDLHKEFGLKDFSLIEYVIDSKGEIYVIEIDSVPILGKGTPIHAMLESVGIDACDFIDHLICCNFK